MKRSKTEKKQQLNDSIDKTLTAEFQSIEAKLDQDGVDVRDLFKEYQQIARKLEAQNQELRETISKQRKKIRNLRKKNNTK